MSNESDKLGPDKWVTSIKKPEDEPLHEEWGAHISDGMTTDRNPAQWSTTLNSIEKTQGTNGNTWSSVLRKIQSRIAESDIWTSRFCYLVSILSLMVSRHG